MVDQLGAAGRRIFTLSGAAERSAFAERGADAAYLAGVYVDGSESNMLSWHRRLQKARLAAPITDAQVRLALSFLRELEPEISELNAFQYRYNALFHDETACTGCIDITLSDVVYQY